ncbi:YqcC family protein [Psychrosphaera algicola]|uniref:YqcC family protein n=1 Tax=Psychrosphaera algicola TaxID=3023714 RepID=A0ABT5FCC8_9GAMM|nr:YqcC family protein [Psychrosphaera sp. G1-22]MDC2888230.1 YqcC family protein [Psychrosphaera sp. G1-22]
MTAKISTYLIELQNALIEEQLWSCETPTVTALSSLEPFAIDTLEIEQWLQFIFIPKMNALIQAGKPLPTQLHLSPIVQMSFANRNLVAPNTLAAVAVIDRKFVEKPFNA